MLLAIYRRLQEILGRLASIEEKLDDIQSTLTPGPADRIILTVGPIQEQPTKGES